jgi:hypothetical protein
MIIGGTFTKDSDGTSFHGLNNYYPPNMRLQPTAQLAANNHASSFASLAMPAQKSRIILSFLAPALLGAPEALAVGLYIKVIYGRKLDNIYSKGSKSNS